MRLICVVAKSNHLLKVFKVTSNWPIGSVCILCIHNIIKLSYANSLRLHGATQLSTNAAFTEPRYFHELHTCPIGI